MNVQTLSRRTSVTFFSKEIQKPYHKHCPLCIASIVYPEKDNRTPAIVFLDMDGVMIGDRFTSPLRGKIKQTLSVLFPQVANFTDYHWTVAKGRHLHPHALQNLHTLIKRIETSGQRALIVLSSAWRNDATLQQHREEAFIQHLFCNYLCGKTAPEDFETHWTPECKQGFSFAQGAKESFGLDLKRRAGVIEYWLRDHGFGLDATNFVVIDDDTSSDLQRFRELFIQTHDLFREEHLEKAAKILKV